MLQCHVPLLSRLGLGGSAILFCSATAGGGLGRSHGVSGATTPFASLTSVCAGSNDETLYVIWGHPAASSAASAASAVAAASKAGEGAAVAEDAEDAAAASGVAAAEGATAPTPTRGHRKSRCRR